MQEFLPFIVIGITAGSVYGLAGTGLVLTYKTSGVFNFAYGAIAAVAAFVFYWLWQREGLSWQVSALLCLFVLGPLLGLLLELLTRMLSNVGVQYQIVGMIGLALGINGLLTLWANSWSSDTFGTIQIPAFLPTETFTVFDVNVGYDQLITVVIALVSTVALFAFFRWSRLGVAMRAVVDNPELVNIAGTNPTRVRRWAWVIGTMFAALAGLLLGPLLGLSAILLILLVVQAFGAAAVGYFSNLPLTYVGGLLIGIAAALSTKYVADITWLGGLPPSIPFIVLFVALLVTPKRLLALRRTPPPPPHSAYTAPLRVSVTGAVLLVGFLVFVPDLVGNNLAAWTIAVMSVILFLSLGLLVRTSGQVSLAQLGLAAVGAAAFGHFVSDHGIPWLPALLLAGLVVVPVGAVIAIPAIRLSGVFLALATLGFGIMLEQMFYTQDFMFGPTATGVRAARPSFATSDRDYYYVILACAVVVAIFVVLMVRTRLGRLLRALSDSPLALDTQGASTNVARVLVFCISAFIAGIYGALYAGFVGSITGASFPAFSSLTIIALVVLVIGGAPWYAVMAAALFQLLPVYVHIDNIQEWLQVLFGFAVIGVGLQARHPASVPEPVRNFLDRLGGRRPAPSPAETAPRPEPVAVATPVVATAASAGGAGLEVVDLTVRFGGLVAVDGLSLEAPLGRITGLIGPNGAGKTTTFNACSGLVRASSGRVVLHGSTITRLGPAARARRGLGRTFQRSELWNSLTVEENVALGREAAMAGGSALHQVLARRGERAKVHESVEHAIDLVGIGDLRGRQSALLTSGERRLVELARALAGAFDVILLDEPSSGLDHAETERFGAVLQQVVAERGIGMLLVEHDMALVMEVCEHIYVLDFGRPIFDGSPDEVRGSELVQAAYLGSDEVEATLSAEASLSAESALSAEPA